MTTIKKAVRKKAVRKKAVRKTTAKATPNNSKGTTQMTTPEATPEAVKMTPVQMCEEMHKKGMSEDEMIQALTEHAGLGIIKAVAAYKNFLKTAGLTETLEEKKAKAFASIKGFVGEDGAVDVAGAVTALVDLMDIGATAARSRIKAYCKENKIEMPAGATREKINVTDEQKAFIIASRNSGATQKETVDAFHKQFPDVNEKSIGTIYRNVCKEAGLTHAVTAIDYAPVITWYKANGDKYDTRKKMSAALMAEFKDMPITAANRYWNFFNFATMYHAASSTQAAPVK